MESKTKMMEQFKDIYFSVLVSMLLPSSSFAIWIIFKSKKHRQDPIFSMIISLFSAGLVQGTFNVFGIKTRWWSLQNNTVMSVYVFVSTWMFLIRFTSMANLSALKLFAIMEPFIFQRVMTMKTILIAVIVTWMTFLILLIPPLFAPSVTYENTTLFPDYDPDFVAGLYGRRIGHIITYIMILILVITTFALYYHTVKHVVKSRKLVAPLSFGTKEERRQAVLSALWSSKGIVVLASVRLALEIPCIALSRIASGMVAFYAQAAVATMPFWDVLCFITSSQRLRKLLRAKLCSCGASINHADLNYSFQ